MRRQSAARKKRKRSNEKLEHARKQAVTMLLQKKTMRCIRDITGLPLGTISRLSQAIKAAEQAKTSTSTVHYNYGPGRKTILTDCEERAICDRMKFVAGRGFATNVDTLKTIAAKIANDGRKGFENGYQSEDWVRSFRSRHPEFVTYRRVENKNVSKLLDEHPDHVESFVRALKECEKQNPGILDDPEMIFNLDETEVGGEHGRLMKAFLGADTHSGGYNMSFTKPRKHLTACIIASAAGVVLPPCFLFEGNKNMDRWYDPLPQEIFKDSAGVRHWLTQSKWYPDNAAEVGTEHSSMTMDTIGLVMSLISLHAPKTPGPDRKLLLILDGHKSRNGLKWLEKAVLFNIEVVQSSADTTEFLQPRDNEINRTFQRAVRSTHDLMNSIAHLNFADLGNRLKLAVAGYRSLTPSIVKKSFENTGIWPMDFRFHILAVLKHTEKQKAVENRNQRVEKRRAGEHMKMVSQMMTSERTPIEQWHSLTSYVNRETLRTSEIIEECTPTKIKLVKFIVEERSGFHMSEAAPGVYLTVQGVLEIRKNNKAKKEAECKAKTEEKVKHAEEKVRAQEAKKEKRALFDKKKEATKQLELSKSKSKQSKRNKFSQPKIPKTTVPAEIDDKRSGPNPDNELVTLFQSSKTFCTNTLGCKEASMLEKM